MREVFTDQAVVCIIDIEPGGFRGGSSLGPESRGVAVNIANTKRAMESFTGALFLCSLI